MDLNEQKKSITLDDLATQMAKGFAKSEKDYGDLATMVANGFTDVTSRMATKDDIKQVRLEMAEMKTELKAEI